MKSTPVYIDTSCFLKLILSEPDSEAVERFVEKSAQRTDTIVVSSLTKVEALTTIRGYCLGHALKPKREKSLFQRALKLLSVEPFEERVLSGMIFTIAEDQLKKSVGGIKGHCRALDRLHLSAMCSLGCTHLLSTDDQQQRAARELKLSVVTF
jgi:predicted nucleic acid-binding protein